MRTRLLLALGLSIVVSTTAAATADGAKKAPLTVTQLARQLRIAFAYVDPKLAKQVTVADLQAIVSETHSDYRLAVIATLPKGTVTAEATAQALLPKLGTARPKVTFVAVAYSGPSGVDIGGAGGNPLLIRDAAATAKTAGKGDLLATMRAFITAYASGKVADNPKASGGGGTSPVIWILIAAVLGGAGLLALRMRKVSRERRGRARVGSIGTARTFHLERLDRLSLRHSELVRTVGERPEDPALAEHHETAGAKLVAIRRQMAGLFSPRELRTCAVELDLVEWHIECAEALIENRPLPPQPSAERTGLCFFTHEHGLGSVEVDLVKPDGTIATVWVCPANAVALSRGEELLVSSVHVGSRLVPWPAVPTYYGAPGWSTEDLPGLEYRGREIWGRAVPQRDEPVDVPPEALPGKAKDEVLPPGVSTPLPPGVTAPPGMGFNRGGTLDDDDFDEAGLPPGVTPPPPPALDAELPIPGGATAVADRDRGADSADHPETPPAVTPPAAFEELDALPSRGVESKPQVDVETSPTLGPDEFDVTDEHPAFRADDTQAYDPFADDDAPPWDHAAADDDDSGKPDAT